MLENRKKNFWKIQKIFFVYNQDKTTKTGFSDLKSAN